jgi:hypothetical protein
VEASKVAINRTTRIDAGAIWRVALLPLGLTYYVIETGYIFLILNGSFSADVK